MRRAVHLGRFSGWEWAGLWDECVREVYDAACGTRADCVLVAKSEKEVTCKRCLAALKKGGE